MTIIMTSHLKIDLADSLPKWPVNWMKISNIQLFSLSPQCCTSLLADPSGTTIVACTAGRHSWSANKRLQLADRWKLCRTLLQRSIQRVQIKCNQRKQWKKNQDNTAAEYIDLCFRPSTRTNLLMVVATDTRISGCSGTYYCAFHVLVQTNLWRCIDFTFCPIKLKLTSIIGRFKTNSDAKFHLNPTAGEEFPHRPPL